MASLPTGRLSDHSAHGSNLFDTPSGVAYRCSCCGRVQVCFNGHALLLREPAFARLQQSVRDALEAMMADNRPTARIEAETADGPVSLVLSSPEVRAFDRLLFGALAMKMLRDSLADIAGGARRDMTIDAARRSPAPPDRRPGANPPR